MGYILEAKDAFFEQMEREGIQTGWEPFLCDPEYAYLLPSIDRMVTKDVRAGANILPAKENIFAAFRTPLTSTKVVILGQDPYHTPGVATGLAFSVAEGAKIPPSLKNIHRELEEDIGPLPDGKEYPSDLNRWAEQGVLLLNTALTVEQGRPASHSAYGWKDFVYTALEYLVAKGGDGPLVAILWGNPAQKYSLIFDCAKSSGTRPVKIIKSAHPSPLSAYRGFFGSKPFSQTNAFLAENGAEPIDWSL